MKTLQFNNYQNTLCEITQLHALSMCQAKPINDTSIINAHDFVKCRDFLNDYTRFEYEVMTRNRNTDMYIYGFYIDNTEYKNQQKEPTNTVELIVKKTNKNFLPKFKFFDRIICDAVKVPHSTIERLTANELTGTHFAITAAPFWKKSPVALSFFTFLLKCYNYTQTYDQSLIQTILQFNDVNTKESNEKVYMRSLNKKLCSFLQLLPDITELTQNVWSYKVNDESIDDLTFHDNCGFITYLKCTETNYREYLYTKNKALIKIPYSSVEEEEDLMHKLIYPKTAKPLAANVG